MKCAHCRHLETQPQSADQIAMAGHGFSRCTGFPLQGHYVSILRDAECERFSRAGEEVIAERREKCKRNQPARNG